MSKVIALVGFAIGGYLLYSAVNPQSTEGYDKQPHITPMDPSQSVDPPEQVQTQEFHYISFEGTDLVIDINKASTSAGANLILFHRKTTGNIDNQLFTFEDGVITSKHSGLCLTAHGIGAGITQEECTGADNQLWQVRNDGRLSPVAYPDLVMSVIGQGQIYYNVITNYVREANSQIIQFIDV